MEQNFEDASVITLVGEDGNAREFEHILTFMYENERYMALAPSDLINDEDADDDDEIEIVFMRIDKQNGEDALTPVENEVLMDELFEVFCELLEGEEEDEPSEE